MSRYVLLRITIISGIAVFIRPFARDQFRFTVLVQLVAGVDVGVARHDPGRHHRDRVELVCEPPRVLLRLHVLSAFVSEGLHTRTRASESHYVLDNHFGRLWVIHKAIQFAVQKSRVGTTKRVTLQQLEYEVVVLNYTARKYLP